MKRAMKWLLLPVLMVAVLTVALPQRAEARVGVWVGYPRYAGYRAYGPGYIAPRAYWAAPYRVYRPAVVVPRLYTPYVAPYVAPRDYWSPYWGW